jgi:vacuolar-type H+-ATPase subunit E/Vma4
MEQEITSEKQVIRNEKGQIIQGTANYNGRPKGVRNMTTKVREALEKIAEGKDYTYEEALIKAILKKAIVDGDTTMMRLIWNYFDGMPLQQVNNNVSGVLNIEISEDIAKKYGFTSEPKEDSAGPDKV